MTSVASIQASRARWSLWIWTITFSGHSPQFGVPQRSLQRSGAAPPAPPVAPPAPSPPVGLSPPVGPSPPGAPPALVGAPVPPSFAAVSPDPPLAGPCP